MIKLVLMLATLMSIPLLWGCASQEVKFSSVSTKVFDDGSFNIKHSALLPSGDTLTYPEVRVYWRWLEFKSSDSQTVSARLIRPIASNVDASKLMCFVGGYRIVPNSLFGIALQVAASGHPALVLIPRGYDINSTLPYSYGVKEVEDLTYALTLYMQVFKTDSLRLNLYTSSSGFNVVLAALAGSKNIIVNAAIVESPIPDLAKAMAKDVPEHITSAIRADLASGTSTIEDFNLSRLLTTRSIQSALVVRGSKDEIVTDAEFDEVLTQIRRSVRNTDTLASACSQHNIRQVVPCNTSDIRTIDARVMQWLTTKW